MIHFLLLIIYMAFISLGLPDALLGSAWPIMHQELSVPVSYMGAVALIISSGTVVSSLLTDRLTRKLGSGLVTAISVATTAVALIGFSAADRYWMLLLWAIPYGLGAGCVDACLNNYVAVHFASRHMSWLHCMWGIGAATGPYIMGAVLTGGNPWNLGYLSLGIFQVALSVFLFASLRVWKKGGEAEEQGSKPVKLSQAIRVPGVVFVLVMFFCYCAIEQTAGQWASSYLVLHNKISEETAATCASLFYIGITVGRFISGFMTMRFSDRTMIRMGTGVAICGILVMLLPLGNIGVMVGLSLIGLGCAPIYPCVIHSTPAYFGADKSQTIIGLQMASAYVGICIVPPAFGLLADAVGIWLLPVVLLCLTGVMMLCHEGLVRKHGNSCAA